jgi:WD40 repeat protein
MILDCTCLPDVRMICVSTVDRDIRFYDFGSSVFIVRFVIQNFPHHITCLSYYFSEQQPGVESKILLGDDGGNVIIITFSPVERGPFRLQLGQSCNVVNYKDIFDGTFKAMRLTTFKSIHEQPVRRIEYFQPINSFISVAKCGADIVLEKEKLAYERTEKSQCPGLVIGYMGDPPSVRSFHADRGMSCFAYNHGRHPLLATGGPDMVVRLWSPARPGRAKALLKYHQAGICFLFFQDAGKYLYSVDKLKEINVWDTSTHNLLQNYTPFTLIFKHMSPVVSFYNDITRELMLVADLKVATVKCRPRIE